MFSLLWFLFFPIAITVPFYFLFLEQGFSSLARSSRVSPVLEAWRLRVARDWCSMEQSELPTSDSNSQGSSQRWWGRCGFTLNCSFLVRQDFWQIAFWSMTFILYLFIVSTVQIPARLWWYHWWIRSWQCLHSNFVQFTIRW